MFYIGIGSRNRAMSKAHRNADWTRVAASAGCVVQIVDVFDQPQDAKQAEVELIDLAKQLGASLTNKSPGGEGGKSPFSIPIDQAIADAHALVKGLGKNRARTAPEPRKDLGKALDAIWAERIARRRA